MSTQVASSVLAESDPPMWGMATLAMEVSSASMKVARVTVMAMAQGLARGRHVSWKVAVAAAANGRSFAQGCVSFFGSRRVCVAAFRLPEAALTGAAGAMSC